LCSAVWEFFSGGRDARCIVHCLGHRSAAGRKQRDDGEEHETTQVSARRTRRRGGDHTPTVGRTAAAFTVGTVPRVSSRALEDTPRADMVRYLLDRDVRVATFVGKGHEATAAAFVSAGGLMSANEGTTVVWLADEVSRRPVPDIAGGLANGGTVIVEASLPVDPQMPPTVFPMLVEIDRVALLSYDGASYRRIEFANGGSQARAITPLGLGELDAVALGGSASHQLVRRDADTSGQAFADHHPAHLSWFRHNPTEPDTETRTSHSLTS
jgi:hypothetical protein